MLLDQKDQTYDKGLSARYLILLFLAGTAVCAVFFSLGFLVGYNEHSSRTAAISAETVSANPSAIPPLVNPPTAGASTSNPSPSATSGVVPPTPVPKGTGDQISTETIGGGKPLPPLKGHATERAPAKTARAPSSLAFEGGPATPAAPSIHSALAGAGSGFTVQVAASRARTDADSLVAILKSHGYPAFLVTPESAHAGDNLYRVQVGQFQNRPDAERLRDRLAKEGFKPFIPKH